MLDYAYLLLVPDGVVSGDLDLVSGQGELLLAGSPTPSPNGFAMFGNDISVSLGTLMTQPDWGFSTEPRPNPIIVIKTIVASNNDFSINIQATDQVYEWDLPPVPISVSPMQ